jgi:DNA primase
MYTEDCVQQVREVAAADVIGRRLDLKRVGNKWKACCPFHEEKSPSFTVTPAQNIWKCFGCQKGGDALAFIMEFEHVEFTRAVEILADECGINLVVANDKLTPEQRQEKKDEKQAMFDLMEWACKLYESQLDDQHREILYARGVTDADILKWRIGYAPDGWKLLTGLLSGEGKLPQAIKLDLVKEKVATSTGSVAGGSGVYGGDVKYYDTFRNRIMLPICDDQERVIGFGAYACKALGYSDEDLKKSKYINSGATPLFNKSEILYGLHHAKKAIIGQKEAGITEGYFDVITAHRHGMQNVVASCGTALTPEHLKKLTRWSTERVAIMQDNDKAGMQARMKAIDLVLEAGMIPKVGIWPEEIKDLDDLLKTQPI